MIKKKIYKFFKDKTEYDKLFFAGRANTLIWIISEYLKSKNISTAVHFVPLPLNKLYRKYSNNKTKNAFQIWKKMERNLLEN